jgi:glycosyltransferase involved in cell wall biosynthesis
MSEAPAFPTLSILLPVRNEATTLARCLDGIFANDYPHDRLEILVIDGQSDDATLDVARQYQQRFPQLRLLDNPRRLPYTALNIALAHATGEYLVRVDARSIIPPHYLRTCIETLRETGADNVGGVQRQYGLTPRQEAIALATGHRFGVGNAQFRLGTQSGFVDTVYLGCFRRELFARLGNFDEDGPVISEDAGFNQRIRDAGGRIYLRADLVVQYPAKATFGALARQYFIYGGAKAHFFLKYRKLTAWRQLVPLVFLLGLVGTFIAGLWWPPARVLFLLGLGSYLAVDLAVALSLAARHRRWDLLPHLVAAFPCIHFPWPVGFLVRLCEGSRPGRHWRG